MSEGKDCPIDGQENKSGGIHSNPGFCQEIQMASEFQFYADDYFATVGFWGEKVRLAILVLKGIEGIPVGSTLEPRPRRTQRRAMLVCLILPAIASPTLSE